METQLKLRLQSRYRLRFVKVVNFKKRPRPASRNQFSRFNEVGFIYIELHTKDETRDDLNIKILNLNMV